MSRPAALRSPSGLLLVEAVLSAVVIATGLTLITRGLSNQLRTMSALEDHDRLLRLAHGLLAELEMLGLSDKSLPAQTTGRFPSPDEACAWSIKASRRDLGPLDLTGQSVPFEVAEVTLLVQQEDGAAAVQLLAVWPAEWVPSSW